MKRTMVKLAILQTRPYATNQKGTEAVLRLLTSAAKSETDIICLPEQWQKENIFDFDAEFASIKKLSKEYGMTIIPGAFYQKKKDGFVISAPVIHNGQIMGTQEKIHPFDFEKNLIKAGSQARVFKTRCRFGIIICYDMVFPMVANLLAKKGAQVLFSPARIVRRGIKPWHLYVKVRALENRIPILAANVLNKRFGGQSIIIDLTENNGVLIPKATRLDGLGSKSVEFDLKRYEKSRRARFSDSTRFS
jgi:predicted amidohydrolase